MASPSTILYLIPGSSSLFPHILLRYCDVPFTPRIIHLSNPAEFDGINDKKQVPVLVVHDNTITENPAIAHAINQLAPEKHILGRTPMEFVKVCEWMNWISGSFHAQAWGPYIRPWRFTTDASAEAQSAVKAAAEQKVLDCYAMLESKLHTNGPWALGEEFTAVDAYIFPFFRLARDRMGLNMKTYPRWSRGYEKLTELEAVKKALEYEQEANTSAT